MQPPKCTRHIHQQLSRIAKSRWALSTVVTTLIVLVISVLLAGVVTYFAINVTSTRVQEESLDLAKQHVWFDFASSKTQAAIMIINSGGRDVVIERLTVRGQQCDWSKVFFNQTAASVSGDLSYASSLSDGTSMSIGGASFVFKQASSAITLQSGKTLIIYLNNPDSISVNDIGLTVSVNIFTSQAMYYKETNVQGTSGTVAEVNQPIPDDPGTSDLVIQYASAYYSGTGDDQVALILTNTGSSTVSFNMDSLYLNGIHQITGDPANVTAHFFSGISSYNSDLPYFTHQLIQGYTLSGGAWGYTVSAGTSWIFYYSSPTFFDSSDVGTTIGVKLLDLSSQSTNTKYITVQLA